eukprot:3027513-Rhodomonas_salina.1
MAPCRGLRVQRSEPCHSHRIRPAVSEQGKVLLLQGMQGSILHCPAQQAQELLPEPPRRWLA